MKAAIVQITDAIPWWAWVITGFVGFLGTCRLMIDGASK